MEIYDENQAIKAINKALTQSGRKPYDDDELLNVIDMIWDYYEENGMLEIDDDFEAEEEEDVAAELIDYINRMLKKDHESTVDPADIATIVKAELDYEDSILD
jgi:flagellar motor component MotA